MKSRDTVSVSALVEASPEPTLSIPAVSLATLIVLSVGFRLTALFLIRYGGAEADYSDFRYYHDLAGLAAQGYFPGVQYWSEYPPIFPWIAVSAYLATLSLPTWIQPYFWFDLALTFVLAAADAGSIVAIDRIADAFWGKGMGRRSATIYAALFAPTFAMLGWFDTLPTFCVLLALWVAIQGARKDRGRTGLAVGLICGIGVMLKLFPVVVLPATLVVAAPARRLRQLAIASGATAVTTLVIALPFLRASPDTFLATFRNVSSRGSWESPWALLDGYYGTGVVASLSDRLYFTPSSSWGQPTHLAVIWYAVALVIGCLFAIQLRNAIAAGTPRAAVAVTALAITLLLLVSRGFSQQFIVWVLPFVIIVMPGLDGAILAVMLTLDTLVLEGYLFVTVFPTFHRLLWISVGVRTVLLIWFALESAAAIDETNPALFRRVRRAIWRPIAAVAMAGAVVGCATLGPAVAFEARHRAGETPIQTVIGNLPSSTAVVFTQPAVYDRLVGVVGSRPTVLVAEPKLLIWTSTRSLNYRLESELRDGPTVAMVTDASAPKAAVDDNVTRWLLARYGKTADLTVGSVKITEYDRTMRPAEHSLDLRFGDGLTLAGESPATMSARAGSPLTVTWRWVADAELGVNYTVSTQLIDPRGALVAQHDAMPVDNTMPTSGWKKGDVIIDPVTLAIPAGLPPGAYSLVVVVYEQQSLRRLSVEGASSALDHAVVGAVVVTQ